VLILVQLKQNAFHFSSTHIRSAAEDRLKQPFCVKLSYSRDLAENELLGISSVAPVMGRRHQYR
jgi:hypothetical protein